MIQRNNRKGKVYWEHYIKLTKILNNINTQYKNDTAHNAKPIGSSRLSGQMVIMSYGNAKPIGSSRLSSQMVIMSYSNANIA